LEHLIACYDQGVAYTDYWLGKLVEGLRQRGLYERTALIVTADHGDEFFEHGGLEHGNSLYDELLLVPLIIRVPGVGERSVVEQQASLIDIMPTVLDLVNVEYRGMVQGSSLVPAMRGQSFPDRTLFAEATMLGGIKASRTNDSKYVERGGGKRQELYDLRTDPRESNNLCAEDRSRCAGPAAEMRRWEEQMTAAAARLDLPDPHAARLDARTRERLRALGYAE
jgi:arylsulfatase A-like enzyme